MTYDVGDYHFIDKNALDAVLQINLIRRSDLSVKDREKHDLNMAIKRGDTGPLNQFKMGPRLTPKMFEPLVDQVVNPWDI